MLSRLMPHLWIAKILAVLATTAVAMYLWHSLAEKYREEGRAQLRPALNKAVTETHNWKRAYAKLEDGLAVCNGSVQNYLKVNMQKQDQSKRMIEIATKQAKESSVAINAALKRIEHGGTCEQAVSDIKKDLK